MLESRLPGEISITLHADDTTLMAESEEELKSLLMKVKEKSGKTGLKLNIKKTAFKHTQQVGSVSYETTAPLSWVPVCTRFCLCPLRVSVSPSPMETL